MREKAMIVLNLIENGTSLTDIMTELKVTHTELSNILKYIRDIGYNYTKNYSSEGKITVKLNHGIGPTFSEKRNLHIDVVNRSIRAIFISDMHIGSQYERPDLLKQVVSYAQDTGCHIIFNGGDVIDNIYADSSIIPKIPTVEKQISHFLRITPFHHNLIYFTLYGNHDFKSLQDKGLDIARLIESKRFDIPSLGYGECIIHIKDDAIALTHDLKKKSKNQIPENVSAVYRGHSHKSKTRDNKIIYIPCLAEPFTAAYEFRPLAGFLDTEFIFFNKKIARINMKQLAFVKSEIRLANEETMILQPEYHENHNSQKKLSKTKK